MAGRGVSEVGAQWSEVGNQDVIVRIQTPECKIQKRRAGFTLIELLAKHVREAMEEFPEDPHVNQQAIVILRSLDR